MANKKNCIQLYRNLLHKAFPAEGKNSANDVRFILEAGLFSRVDFHYFDS